MSIPQLAKYCLRPQAMQPRYCICHLPRLLLPPFLPIFLFTPQSFCCRFVIVVSFTGTHSSVVDPDPEVQTLNLSIFGNLYQQKTAIFDSDYIPYTVHSVPGTGTAGTVGQVFCCNLCNFVHSLAKIGIDSGPGSGSDDSKSDWIRNQLFRIHNTLLPVLLLFSLIVNLLIFLLQFPASFVSI